ASDFEVEVPEGAPRDAALDVRAVLGGSLGLAFTRGGAYVVAKIRAEVRDERGRVVATRAPELGIGGMAFQLPPGTHSGALTPDGSPTQTQSAAVVAGRVATVKFEVP